MTDKLTRSERLDEMLNALEEALSILKHLVDDLDKEITTAQREEEEEDNG